MKKINELISNMTKRDIGFRIDEVMTGHHEFEKNCGPKGRLFMEFRGQWGPDDLRNWINPASEVFFKQKLSGTVTVEGLCRDVPMTGELALNYFKDASIKYSFEFKARQKGYCYVGQKVNIKPWNLLFSHTTCFGRITEKKTGKLVSTSVVYFKLLSLPKFLASLKLV
ncbi:MAG: hypothetical protein ACD_62C00039G0002 [uncultured bacterium]|nr:MAG: hypothetical protein ACD_62C00039G0002 [uncultured bacterium]HLD43939.1 hypothetical protein [bacterium]